MCTVDWTSQQVLGEALRRGREAVGRSPEQVGAIVGVAGRTIRRLEAGESERPRRVTLEGLAGFYGFDPRALWELADAPGDPPRILERLRDEVSTRTAPEVVEALEGVDDEPVELAMRWLRSRPAGGNGDDLDGAQEHVVALLNELRKNSAREHGDAVEALRMLASLDRSRRALALALLKDLRAAQDAEARRSAR